MRAPIKITKEITVFDEFAVGPDVAVIPIDESLAARIIALAKWVNDLEVVVISLFHDPPLDLYVWDLESNEEGAYKKPEDVRECSVECVMLNVTRTDFWWSGLKKHTSVRWETHSIPLSVLTPSQG